MKMTRIVVILILVQTTLVYCNGTNEAKSISSPILKRGLLKGKSQTTTTTTTEAPEPIADIEYEDYADEGGVVDEVATEATSTTPGKKLITGGVRPFRSNADLLEALKRRRAEVKTQTHSSSSFGQHSTSTTTTEATNAKSSGKKRSQSKPDSKSSDHVADSVGAKPSRKYASRSSTKISASEPAPVEEKSKSTEATIRTGRFYRRGSIN